MQRILILGATSMIAEHAARLWATRGDALCLVARRGDRLEAIAADLRTRGASAVHTQALDLLDFDSHGALIDASREALGGLDVVLIAHGVLSSDAADLTTQVRTMLDVNATSAISLAEQVARVFEAQRGGVLATIGSVAGDRGRASNALYGAAKAAVATHASALRQRLSRVGAFAVTVKPGFVDTPMTAAFPKGPLWAAPEQVARGIVDAIDGRRAVVYLPWFWAWIMRIVRAVPERIFVRMKF